VTPAGYSGTPLIRKLGLRSGMTARLFHPPVDYETLLGTPLAELGVRLLTREQDGAADFSHVFTTRLDVLRETLTTARAGMAADGMVWVSWPKKASGVASEVSQADVMAGGKAVGLVDVKVCAVDETWSGLKLVIPVRDRKSA
jgi:hypothetical protein